MSEFTVTLPELVSGGSHRVYHLPAGAEATFDPATRRLHATAWPVGQYEVGYAGWGGEANGAAPTVSTRLSIGVVPTEDGYFPQSAPAPASESKPKAKPKG